MPRYPPSHCPYCGSALDPGQYPGGRCLACGEFTAQQPVVAAEVLVVDGKRVLLQKRATGRMAGTWGFPGGHPEPAETPWDAGIRELNEETGLEASAADLVSFDAVFDENPDGSYYLVLGFGLSRSDTSGSLDSSGDETTDLRFLDPTAMTDAVELFHPAYRDRMRRAIHTVEAAGTPTNRRLDLR